jgi:hypothetical protein
LKYITRNNILSENIISWDKNNIEINFVFDWKFNRELYLKTTAWMVLPLEVREVNVNGQTFSRNSNSLKWEFYNNSWKRLVIKDWTNIDISKKIETSENKVTLNPNLSKGIYFLKMESDKGMLSEKIIIK